MARWPHWLQASAAERGGPGYTIYNQVGQWVTQHLPSSLEVGHSTRCHDGNRVSKTVRWLHPALCAVCSPLSHSLQTLSPSACPDPPTWTHPCTFLSCTTDTGENVSSSGKTHQKKKNLKNEFVSGKNIKVNKINRIIIGHLRYKIAHCSIIDSCFISTFQLLWCHFSTLLFQSPPYFAFYCLLTHPFSSVYGSAKAGTQGFMHGSKCSITDFHPATSFHFASLTSCLILRTGCPNNACLSAKRGWYEDRVFPHPPYCIERPEVEVSSQGLRSRKSVCWIIFKEEPMGTSE